MLFVLIVSLLVVACNNNPKKEDCDDCPANLDYQLVKTYPHDTTAYTEGLLFHDGQLYESTGTEANMPPERRSLFGTVDLATGKITPKAELDRRMYFGEGIVFLGGKVYQLTYTTKIGFIYDAKTFKQLGEFTFPNREGWGMTTDGKYLIMSDGTSNVSYYDPDSSRPVEVKIRYDNGDSVTKTLPSFRLVRTLTVSDNNGPDSNINELEMINGFLYANQWQTNYILKIDTTNGRVVARLDLGDLVKKALDQYPDAEVLNGIAYDSATGKIYVTGKLWPYIFEINFPH
jgi:glutaminyl-peptide cyclotransferase